MSYFGTNVSGYSGYSGTGVSGFSGKSGFSGANGSTGTSGFSGTNGSAGTSGFSGYSGVSGFSGAGTSGFSGKSGFSGTTGSAGTSGFSGIFGGDSQSYLFDPGTGDSDPGNGNFRFNNPSTSSTTRVFMNTKNSDTIDVTTWLQSLDDISSSSVRGRLRFVNSGDSSIFAVFNIISANISATGYEKINIAYVTGNGTFNPADKVIVNFSFAGESGFSGSNGSTGTSGFSGYSGVSGFSGKSGFSGTATSGFSGYSGNGGGGMTWTEITTPTQNMTVNNGYIANRGTQIQFNLPATAAVGSILAVVGKGSGGWSVKVSGGQVIYLTPLSTTPTGSVDSAQQYDCVEIICIVTDTDWVVRSYAGNLNVF